MNLSMKWLSEYVDLNVSTKEFAAAMTMSGSKVESYQKEGSPVTGVVVGKVLEVTKHPNADTLYICQVDVGGERPLQIVTGADNVVPGAYVPVFTDGSVTADGKKIKKGKLRGEVSEGMLASLGELGLTKGDFPYAREDGIFLLGDDCPVDHLGQDALEVIGLNDTTVEFEITPNRPDCLSVRGLAREAAVTFEVPLKLHQPVVKGSGGSVHDYLKVRVENQELCLRYSAAVVKNVKIGPSPRWMRERLRASGVRPINNIVDITNYVMLEYGQPMHAFDLVHVKGSQIVVRNAAPGETIATLDGVERTLSPEMLVIADESSPSAVAGVMGGEFSGVYETTQTVVFESACFYGPSVRSTSKKLGLRTESSSRFEKGLDPENCIPALRRACELVELLGAGEVVDGVIDIAAPQKPLVTLKLDHQWICNFLGVEIPREKMEHWLRELGFAIQGDLVTAPSWRRDVTCQQDLAEEVARLYGYDNIPSTIIRGEAKARPTEKQRFVRTVHQALLAQGLNEIITYSFFSPKNYDLIRLPADSPLRRSVTILNPLGEDTSVMRTTAIPSMLETLARNFRARSESARLYELATEYIPTEDGKLPLEPRKIVIGLYGPDEDFFTLKGIVEALLEQTRVFDWEAEPVTDHPTFHPGRCARLQLGDVTLGVIGQVHPAVAENYKVDMPLYVAHLDLEALLQNTSGSPVYKPLPRFPVSTRDLALVCDESVTNAQITSTLKKSMGKLLAEWKLFDVYRSVERLGAGKKSLAYSLTLRAEDRTLTDEECDKAIAKALKALEQIGVFLRQ